MPPRERLPQLTDAQKTCTHILRQTDRQSDRHLVKTDSQSDTYTRIYRPAHHLHTHILSPSLSLSLIDAHTHTYIHTPSHAHAYTRTLVHTHTPPEARMTDACAHSPRSLSVSPFFPSSLSLPLSFSQNKQKTEQYHKHKHKK